MSHITADREKLERAGRPLSLVGGFLPGRTERQLVILMIRRFSVRKTERRRLLVSERARK